MGLFDWLRGTSRHATNHQLSGQYSFLFGPTTAGRTVTERSAMQMTAVYSCVRILAEAIAGLPLHVYRTGPDGSKVKATDHGLYRLLHAEPNPEMTSFVFRETLDPPIAVGQRLRPSPTKRPRRGDRAISVDAQPHVGRARRHGKALLRVPNQ